MAKLRTIHHRLSNKSKAKSQQHRRRGNTLFRKAFEFSKECDADVTLVLRLRKTGQIYIFNSNDQWSPSQEDLVGITIIFDEPYWCFQMHHYPTPLRITRRELAAKYEGKLEDWSLLNCGKRIERAWWLPFIDNCSIGTGKRTLQNSPRLSLLI